VGRPAFEERRTLLFMGDRRLVSMVLLGLDAAAVAVEAVADMGELNPKTLLPIPPPIGVPGGPRARAARALATLVRMAPPVVLPVCAILEIEDGDWRPG
jgi:hypothetical protein